MNLQSNDFELFGVAEQFVQDAGQLAERWKLLQKEAHPDRFAAQGAAAQRVAMQWSVRINEAYQRLKDPLKRAAYLCELHGAPIRAEDNTAMPAAFLMQQMEWREALADARTLAQVEALAADVASHRQRDLEALRVLVDERGDMAAAAQQLRALMFVERFAADVDRRLEALEQ